MGSESGEAIAADGEGPCRVVTVAPFAISPTAVTNEQFAAFCEATGHVTDAERYGWSFVFVGLLSPGGRGRGRAGGGGGRPRGGGGGGRRARRGGRSSTAPAGPRPRARARTGTGAPIIRWCTSRTRTRSPTAPGP